MLTGINDTLLLIALGIGYLVLYFARREEKGLQFAGYIIGFTIITLATLYLLLNFWIYSWIRCPTNAQPNKAMMYQRMKQHGAMGPWLPKELPKNP